MDEKEKKARKPVADITCPECTLYDRYDSIGVINKATIDTDWEPPKGIDPRMHKFICSCGYEFYKVIGGRQEQNLQATMG